MWLIPLNVDQTRSGYGFKVVFTISFKGDVLVVVTSTVTSADDVRM